MDRIAFIIGNTFLYWNSIVLTLSVAAAICFFLAFYLNRDGNVLAASAFVPLAMVLSLVLSRLAHWYFRPDSYSGFLSAMTDYTSGGYALMGVLLGCILAASVVRLIGLEKNLPALLDALAISGCGGIALGRLACFFSTADRGQILQSVTSLPFAYPVANAVTGAAEYRLATFVIQAMAAGLVFAILVVFWFLAKTEKGDIALLFLLLYGLSQTVLDSTRYDSLYMRSNGFISVEQLLGAASMVFVCAFLSCRLIRRKGFSPLYIPIWVGMAASLGAAAYMEYYVQRHGDLPLFCYSIMTACLSLMAVLALHVYSMTIQLQKKKA